MLFAASCKIVDLVELVSVLVPVVRSFGVTDLALCVLECGLACQVVRVARFSEACDIATDLRIVILTKIDLVVMVSLDRGKGLFCVTPVDTNADV